MVLNSDQRTNRLLTLLSNDDYERLRPHLVCVDLEYKKILCEIFRPIEDIYFPVDGVASLVNIMEDGSAAEVGTIGSEGLVGSPVVLGDQYSPMSVYVQVPGTALKIATPTFREELTRSPTLKRRSEKARVRMLRDFKARV
jgi:CRP-like cAMP-binding protein